MAFGKKLDSRLDALSRASRAQVDQPIVSRKRVQRDERQETYKFGRVRYEGGGDLSCIVQDMSASGAKVKLQGAYALPPRVILSIVEIGVKKICLVRWQENDVVGLEFVQQG